MKRKFFDKLSVVVLLMLLHQGSSAEIFNREINPPGLLVWQKVLSDTVNKSQSDEVWFMLSVDDNLNAIDPMGKVLWQTEVKSVESVSAKLPLVVTLKNSGDKVAFVWGKDGVLYAKDFLTGRALWNSSEVLENYPTLERPYRPGKGYYDGDFVYYVTEAGSLKRVDLRNFRVSVVYVPTTSGRKKTKGVLTSPPIVYHYPGHGLSATVWVGTKDGYVLGINKETGKVLHTYPQDDRPYGQRTDNGGVVKTIPVLPHENSLYFTRTSSRDEVEVLFVKNPLSAKGETPKRISLKLNGGLSQAPEKTDDGYVLFTSNAGELLVLDSNGNKAFPRGREESFGKALLAKVWYEGEGYGGQKRVLILASEAESTNAEPKFPQTDIKVFDFRLTGDGVLQITPKPADKPLLLLGQTRLPFQVDSKKDRLLIDTMVTETKTGDRNVGRSQNIASLLYPVSVSVDPAALETTKAPILNRRVDAVGLVRFEKRVASGEQREILLAPSDFYLAVALNAANKEFIGALEKRKKGVNLTENLRNTNATYLFRSGDDYFVAAGKAVRYFKDKTKSYQTDYVSVEPLVDEERKICYLPDKRKLVAVSLEQGDKFLSALGSTPIETSATSGNTQETLITTQPILSKERGELYLTDSDGFVHIYKVNHSEAEVTFDIQWIITTFPDSSDPSKRGIAAQPFFDSENQTLYVGNQAGIVCAIDLQRLPTNEYSLTLNSPGVDEIDIGNPIATSLIVSENTLYFGADLERGGRVHAVDLRDEFNTDQVWQASFDIRGKLSSTMLAIDEKVYVAGGQTLYALSTQDITALDKRDKKKVLPLWQFETDSPIVELYHPHDELGQAEDTAWRDASNIYLYCNDGSLHKLDIR